MKEKLFFLCLLLGLLTVCLAACQSGNGAFRQAEANGCTYQLTYDLGNGQVDGKNSLLYFVQPDAPLPKLGKTSGTTAPVFSGYRLIGYYTKGADGTETDWDFVTDRIRGNMTLYARWEKNFTVQIRYGENNYMIYIFGGNVRSSLQPDGTTSYSIGNTTCTPPSLKKLTVAGTVSAIPDFAFAYLSGVTDIVCQGTVTAIGNYAYCQSGLTRLSIPNTVTQIGEYAFAAMNDLVEVTIPGSVGGNLGAAIFYNTSSLETVVFGEGVTRIPENAFLPVGSRNADTDELNYYSSIKSITLPATLEEIGAYAFAYVGTRYIGQYGSVYENIRFVLPADSHLVTVEEGAFYRSSISSIALPACLTEVKQMAFFGCCNLGTVSFGDAVNGSSLEKIGGAAFALCTGLRKMTIYKAVTDAADVPALDRYTVSSTTENLSYNVFSDGTVPAIYVFGADIYRGAANWDEYDTRIFEIN